MPSDATLLSITRSVNDLAVTTRALSSGHARSIRVTWWVVAALALLAFVLTYQVLKLRRLAIVATENRAQIQANQDALDVAQRRSDANQVNIAELQERTSAQVLCPMWQLFLKSYNPERPDAKMDPKAYEDAFVVIEAGAETLGCAVTKRVRR